MRTIPLGFVLLALSAAAQPLPSEAAQQERLRKYEQITASGRPGDLALAMLAKGGPDRVVEIVRRLRRFASGGLRGGLVLSAHL